MKSLAENLIERLELVVQTMDELLDASTIDYVPNRAQRESYDGVFALVPNGSWGPANDTQRNLQRRLLELWTPLIEQIRLVFSGDTKNRREELRQAAEDTKSWIERDNFWDVPPTIPEAKQRFRDYVDPLIEMLKAVGLEPGQVVAVPDSNVLLRSPDITKYDAALGTSAYTVLLVPGVLGEMDQHKVNHRNKDVRERARKFSSRLKGWRNQGRLAEGVKVQGDIWVQVEGREPDFSKTLAGLDPTVTDDRIVASILEYQRRRPSDQLVLLTGDSIMLAKADLASIPTADTPDPEV